MADKVNYEQTNPEYDAAVGDYGRMWALYQGGRAVEKGGFLVKPLHESPQQYKVREKRAAYKNFAAPIVDLFATSITDGVKREGLDIDKGKEVVKRLLKDCTRTGKNPDAFFKEAATIAAGRGAHFVAIDVPPGEAKNMKEAKDKNLFPYFVHVSAPNLIDWGFGSDGALSYVCIKAEEDVNSGEAFSRYTKKTSVTVWTRTEWERFVKNNKGEFETEDKKAHNLGLVPVVPFLYEPLTSMTGKSAIDDVASLILRVFCADNEYDKSLFDSCIPQMVATGITKPEIEVIKSSTNIWCFSKPDARVVYVEPSGGAYSAKRQQILDDINAIREISLRQVRPPSGIGESAESKRLDNVQISSQLAEFARRCAAAEAACWRIALKWKGVDNIDFSIKYNENFDPQAVGERLKELFMQLRSNGDISRETLWEKLKAMGDLPENFDPADELARIESEAKGNAGPNGAGARDLAAGILGKGADAGGGVQQ